MLNRLITTTLAAGLAFIALPATNADATCYILVHGHRSSDGVPGDKYWTVGESQSNVGVTGKDGIKDVTNNYADDYCVINYDGYDRAYWSAAIEVANEITDCACFNNSGPDVVIPHSQGASVMQFILGNSDPSDPYYNYGGAPFNQVAAGLEENDPVGACVGCESADAICGSSGLFCSIVGGLVSIFSENDCDVGTEWLQTGGHRVFNFSTSPSVSTWALGGYEGDLSSSCLSGEDDAIVQYSSAFSCANSTGSYDNGDGPGVCTKATTGLHALAGSHERHDDLRDGSDNEKDCVLCWGDSMEHFEYGCLPDGDYTAMDEIDCYW